MDWQLILVLVIVIPIVIFPAAFIWYLNIGGLFQAIDEARARKRAVREATSILENAK